MSVYTFNGGFSSSSGQKKSSSEKEHKPEENIEDSDQPKNTKNDKDNQNINTKYKHMKRVRRGGDSKKNHVIGHCATSLEIFSANGASLRNGKMDSLNEEVRAIQSNIMTLQETHFTKKGKI